LTGHFQESVDSPADALKAAASGTHEFTDEPSAVLATASTEITKLAASLSAHAVDAAKDAARNMPNTRWRPIRWHRWQRR